MKKIAILLGLILCITITGCTSKGNNENTDSIQTNVEESKETLSEDIYNFELLLNDKKYTLPFDFEEIGKDGWISASEENELIESKRTSLEKKFTNETMEILLNFVNLKDEAASYDKCKVSGIKIDAFAISSGIKIELPKAITTTSTKEEIINAYGEPSKRTSTSDYEKLHYEIDDNHKISFGFYKDEMTAIEMNNLDYTEKSKDKDDSSKDKTKEDSANESGQSEDVQGDVIDIPVIELGQDIGNRNFELGGVVYTMGTPIQAFLSNGWTINNGAGKSIKANGFAFDITLRKDNSVISIGVKNNSENEAAVESCSVVSVTVQLKNNVSLKVPNGVQIGTAKEELETALSTIIFEKSEVEGILNYKYYATNGDYNITFKVDNETNTVSYINIQEY